MKQIFFSLTLILSMYSHNSFAKKKNLRGKVERHVEKRRKPSKPNRNKNQWYAIHKKSVLSMCDVKAKNFTMEAIFCNTKIMLSMEERLKIANFEGRIDQLREIMKGDQFAIDKLSKSCEEQKSIAMKALMRCNKQRHYGKCLQNSSYRKARDYYGRILRVQMQMHQNSSDNAYGAVKEYQRRICDIKS